HASHPPSLPEPQCTLPEPSTDLLPQYPAGPPGHPPALPRPALTRYPGEPPDSGGEHARAERPPDAGPRGPDARPRRRAQPYAAPQRPPAGPAEPGARAALQPGRDRRRHGWSGDRRRGGRARRAGRPDRAVPARRRLLE